MRRLGHCQNWTPRPAWTLQSACEFEKVRSVIFRIDARIEHGIIASVFVLSDEPYTRSYCLLTASFARFAAVVGSP